MGVATLPLVAQQAPGAAPGGDANPPRQRYHGGGNGGGDRMAEMRERMTTRLKEDLGCTDEEFKAIQPKLEKVIQLRMRSIMGDAVQELNKVLKNKDAKAEEIQAKLKAVREAKKTTKEALTKAEDELRELLTVRQEAQMVANGILE
jgi:Spy/CpxP family protein refolding chaperone